MISRLGVAEPLPGCLGLSLKVRTLQGALLFQPGSTWPELVLSLSKGKAFPEPFDKLRTCFVEGLASGCHWHRCGNTQAGDHFRLYLEIIYLISGV